MTDSFGVLEETGRPRSQGLRRGQGVRKEHDSTHTEEVSSPLRDLSTGGRTHSERCSTPSDETEEGGPVYYPVSQNPSLYLVVGVPVRSPGLSTVDLSGKVCWLIILVVFN